MRSYYFCTRRCIIHADVINMRVALRGVLNNKFARGEKYSKFNSFERRSIINDLSTERKLFYKQLSSWGI